MKVLQTFALPLGHVTIMSEKPAFGAGFHYLSGAADEARTRYLHLGKVALYQMSYGRIKSVFFTKNTQENGASDRNRTNDTGIFSPLLYRLSYRGIMATRIRLELTTSSVTGWCSNQLSYRATWWKLTGSNR